MFFGPTTADETRAHLAECLATAAEEPRRIYELAVVLRASGQAMRTLFHSGFTVLHTHRFEDTCDIRNHASARVMEKLGMRREGYLRETHCWRDGRWYDEYLYGILAHEWAG